MPPWPRLPACSRTTGCGRPSAHFCSSVRAVPAGREQDARAPLWHGHTPALTADVSLERSGRAEAPRYPESQPPPVGRCYAMRLLFNYAVLALEPRRAGQVAGGHLPEPGRRQLDKTLAAASDGHDGRAGPQARSRSLGWCSPLRAPSRAAVSRPDSALPPVTRTSMPDERVEAGRERQVAAEAPARASAGAGTQADAARGGAV
jgi:hypothetical protein